MSGWLRGTGAPNDAVLYRWRGHRYLSVREFDRAHQRGVLSMARSQHPDSAGSQFFICLADAKFLDRQYTAFGCLVEGDDVLGQIGDTPTTTGSGSERSKPVTRVGVERIRIVPGDACFPAEGKFC